jgi:hypothetical protein
VGIETADLNIRECRIHPIIANQSLYVSIQYRFEMRVVTEPGKDTVASRHITRL